ncbi:uncharacterized protein VTP21DRAFT_3887 [Calcarisporiella thermophila]|uniref:uncharacterized protein n=1 Tax=Calcarisporiella thermophila TaxID=911321 RepID=UPI0037449DAD
MADTGRKGFMDQAKQALTPDQEKTASQRASERISGAADRVAAAVTPDGQKSYGQQMADSTRGASDKSSGQESMLDKAKDALGLNK